MKRTSSPSFWSFILVLLLNLDNGIEFRSKILAEAKTYAEVAGASYISKVHVSDAAMSLYKRNFAMGRTVGEKGWNQL